MRHLRRVSRRGALALAGCRHRTASGVALTFDDGPDPTWTPRLLDLLAEHRAAATFFLVGDAAEANPDLVRRMVDEGHAVGSHTRTHPDLWTLSIPKLRTEIGDGRAQVEGAAGRSCTLFRPCKGHVDWNVAVAMRATGVDPWLWSASPDDWRPGVTVAEVLSGLEQLADGDVVLLHDGLEQPWAPEAKDRSPTLDALPALIERIRSKGLALTTLGGDR